MKALFLTLFLLVCIVAISFAVHSFRKYILGKKEKHD